MSREAALANDIEDELKAKNLAPFVLRAESKVEELVIEVYENQSWHPVLQSWGSVVGVHLNAVLDRSPYTDESGVKVLSGSLSEVKPLNKYKWAGEWAVRAQRGVTDAQGFQYAPSWSLLSNKYNPSDASSSLVYVRRRRFTRKMVVDPDPPSKALPYELTIKVIGATIQGVSSVTHSYVEVFLDRVFLDRTSAGTPNWNHKLTKKIMQLEPEMTITFVVYSKKVFTVVNPFHSGPAPIEMIHRGTAHIVVLDFLDNLSVINKEADIELISPTTGQKCGTVTMRLDVLETKLFGVVPAFDDSLQELKKRTEDALPYDLRYEISTLDNNENSFLKVLVNNVIEGREVLTEADLVDIVGEAGYIQQTAEDAAAADQGADDTIKKVVKQADRYPPGKPRYGKLITLPSSLEERNDAVLQEHLKRALAREEELQKKNEYYDRSLPSVSSVFDPLTLGANGFDLAYQPYQQDAEKSDYYDLMIYCIPEDSMEADLAHVLRWTSYYEYVMMIRELVKIQHQFNTQESPVAIIRHTCKVLYGTRGSNDAQPTNWIPVNFTVDSEAEFLVIRESRVAREDQQESFDKIISFEQVEGIVVKNTYHLSSHYILDLKVHSASSLHLKNVLANLHIETTDGRQRFNYKSEAFRKGSAAEGKPGTVTFQDSHTFLLPPSALKTPTFTGGEPVRECLHVTFSSEENSQTDTAPVMGRLDLPLSKLLPTMGKNMTDCQISFKNLNQEYELRLKVLSIADLFWKDPAHLFSLDFQQSEEADPYFVVYFADENGQIISLTGGSSTGGLAVVQDLASNLAYLSTAGMVGSKGEGQSVVGNVARDLVYLGTAGMVGGKTETKKNQGIYPADNESSGSIVGNVASNLLYVGTAGMVGGKKDGKQSVTQQAEGILGTPQRTATGMMKQGAGNLLSMSTGGLIGGPGGGNNNKSSTDLARVSAVTPNAKGRPNSEQINAKSRSSVARAAGDVTSGLMQLGANTIQGTSNVIVGTSNVAVNVLTLGNAGIVSTMNKADAVYQSPVVYKTVNPTWDEEIVLSTEKYGDIMRSAKYLLVEVWDKNTALADVCLGEVYLPVVCAQKVDPKVPPANIPRTMGLRKFPLQLSKHMKINRTAAKRLPAGLGSLRAQLLYKEAAPLPDATPRERGEVDPIKVSILLQLKPVGALDFAWPSRIVSNGQSADSMESDILYMRLKHDGLHLALTNAAVPTDRAKMLLECKERVKNPPPTADKNSICLIVPYDQIATGVSSILTTDALACSITLTRLVPSTTQKGSMVERPAELDLLIGPCPASDVYTILHQRVTLSHFRTTLKKIAGIQPTLDELDVVGRDLQQDILATSHDIDDLSTHTTSATILESLVKAPAKTAAGEVVLFSDNINRMSVTYFSTKLQVRVLMARKAFLKAYFWHVLEFSKFAVAKVVGKTILPNFDKEMDLDAINVLTKRARAMLKYGDPTKLGDGTDSDDSDEDEAKATKRRAKKEVSTSSLVSRMQSIMTQLAMDLRRLLFQAYRRKFTPSYCEFLATKLVYEQYLVIVGYLANILLDEASEGHIPSQLTQGAQTADKSFSAQMMHFTNVATSVATSALTLGTVKMNTGSDHAAPEVKAVAKKMDAQRKHDLISFVLSQDNLFEQYLHANLFACEYKFTTRPHLSMCLDFDVLIGKFSDMLNENIQMWNSKALKVFMCRKVEEGVAPSKLPWDITTLRDDSTRNELYISHIPESIQIQLNVQIGMKKINTTGMGDNLSIMSIKRIYEINLRIAKAIARAYLALAVEYENFLDETISALSSPDANAGNRVTSMIQNIGVKMIEVGTLGVINVGANEATTPGGAGSGSGRGNETSQEESDELLCFLMSIVNDCTRINKEHIPQSIASFVKEFADGGDAILHAGPGSDNRSVSSESAHGKTGAGGLTAAEEINGFFFNPIKAIKSVSRHAINCLTNQVFFHGDLREYFLRTFSDHLVVPKAATSSMFTLGGKGGDASPTEPQEGAEAEAENPVATIVATLQDMYGFTASHVGAEDQHRIVHNCLKKVIMRYLLMLRDILVAKASARMGSTLNSSINTGINTGMKVGRTVLNITTLGLAGGTESGSTDNIADMDRSTSSSQTGQSTAGESFSAAQLGEIRQDLEVVMHAHMDVADDKVAELLQFFNKAVNSILSGATCDPKSIDIVLLNRFHLQPPVYNADPLVYDRLLESYIGLNASTHELTQTEIENRMNRNYTIQFQDFTCVNLKDYKVCVVRVTFSNITLQSSILASSNIGSAQIRWKDILRFEHVKGYSSKDVLVEIVEIRPMGLRREAVLARVRVQLSELSQFITPEPYPAKTGGKIVSSPTAGHSGWFVLEEVPAEIYSGKGITNMLRDVTVGTMNTTRSVTSSVASTTVNTLMMPLKMGEDTDTLGTSSTGKDSCAGSTGKGSVAAAAAGASATPTPAGKAKNSYLSILSSDQPRDDVTAPQLKIRIRIVEEKQ